MYCVYSKKIGPEESWVPPNSNLPLTLPSHGMVDWSMIPQISWSKTQNLRMLLYIAKKGFEDIINDIEMGQ